MSNETMSPQNAVLAEVYNATGQYLEMLLPGEHGVQGMEIIEAHDRLCKVFQTPAFRHLRESVGKLVFNHPNQQLFQNWVKFGQLRDQIMWIAHPHKQVDNILVVVASVRTLVEILRVNDLPAIDTHYSA